MRNTARGIVEIVLPPDLSKVVFKSLSPEIITSPKERHRGKLKRDGDIISIEIEAEDTVALRAALNSYLRLLKIILGINELI
ncbi:MAG: KEOPS complex subunit Pcc1 [Candidatus Freyarchaeota archaeon]